MTSSRRFPAPWTVEQVPGGYKVLDGNAGDWLSIVYAERRRRAASRALSIAITFPPWAVSKSRIF